MKSKGEATARKETKGYIIIIIIIKIIGSMLRRSAGEDVDRI